MADNLTPRQRRHCMSQVKGSDTSLECKVRSRLHREGLRFRKHVSTLAGKPDVVFPAARLVVFLDGDFWHGWQFPRWKHKLGDYWQQKIERNRRRDRRVQARLRRQGWCVLRIWEHEVDRSLDHCVQRIIHTHRRCLRQQQEAR